MTHPLIEFLKTPMAAPETARLRHMRRWWIALCWALALAVLLLPHLKALFGLWGSVPALILALAAPLHGARYLTAKNRADAAYSKGEDAR